MTNHDNQTESKALDVEVSATEQPCPQRRRLLTMLGVGIVTPSPWRVPGI